jgi:hypothetical protein
MARVMLTTIDNPFSPFTEFTAWYGFDVSSGYHTSDFLARILTDSDDMSDPDIDLSIEQAIDEVVKFNVLGIYRKVVEGEPIPKPLTAA